MSDGESKFGFKDMEKALETLKLLESHDIQYRKLTVRGLLGRAKRVLTCKLPWRVILEFQYISLVHTHSDKGSGEGEEHQRRHRCVRELAGGEWRQCIQ